MLSRERLRRSGSAATRKRPHGSPLNDVVLGPYLPQVKWLERPRRERLSAADVSVVAVRLKEVMRHGRIRRASELRENTGLGDDVAVVLLLHGEDELLERLASSEFATEIAAGGYSLVTSPSFSLWEPQRRPDNVLSLRRSMLYFGELQAAGANVCPRVAWVEPVDAERLAAWTNRYKLSLVSLDLMTYAGRSFDRAIAGLAHFDELTGQRVHYLVDGVCAAARVEALYLAAAPDRVTVSSATLTPPASRFGGARTLPARAAFVTERCRVAQANVQAAHASSLDAFVAETSIERLVGELDESARVA